MPEPVHESLAECGPQKSHLVQGASFPFASLFPSRLQCSLCYPWDPHHFFQPVTGPTPSPNLVPICQSIWGQCVCMCACLLSHSVMSDSFVSPHDRMDCSPPGSSSMGFSRQAYWSGLPCSSPRDPPDPGIKPESLASPAWAGGFFSTRATWEALSLQQSRGNRGPLCALPPRDLESLHKYPNN